MEGRRDDDHALSHSKVIERVPARTSGPILCHHSSAERLEREMESDRAKELPSSWPQ
jgi:hypothetical protein